MSFGGSSGVYSQNPEYQRMYDSFVLANDAYHGTGQFQTGRALDLFSVRENSDRYLERRRSAYYLNILRPIVNVFVNAIFGTGISRQNGTPLAYPGSIHGDFDETLRFSTIYAKLFGVSIIQLDRPQGELMSEADRAALPPYLNVINPLMVPDWSLTNGEFDWIKVYEPRPQARGDWKNPEKKAADLRIWDKNGWYLFRKDKDEWEEIASGPNNFGFVPFVPHWNEQPTDGSSLYGSTETIQMARMNRRVYNLMSEIDDQLRGSAFNVLVVPTHQGMPQDIEIGAQSAIFYDPQEGGVVAFVAPDSAPAKLCMENVEQLKGYMYEAARLDKQAGIKPYSATERIYLGEEAERSIRALAMQGEQAEYRIMRALAKFEGLGELGEYETVWPKKYDQFILGDNYMARTIQALSINWTSQTARKEFEKHFVKSLIPLADEKVTQILDEIENGPGGVTFNQANNETPRESMPDER